MKVTDNEEHMSSSAFNTTEALKEDQENEDPSMETLHFMSLRVLITDLKDI